MESGGIGKTAIARAYVRRHQEEYDSVLFLSCDIGFSPLFCDDIRVAVSNLHYSKDKYGSKKQYFKEKMKALTEIGEESRFLLVLDDCNREADPYMEQIFALPCDILVTTRVDPAMWGVAGGIPVTELEPAGNGKSLSGRTGDRSRRRRNGKNIGNTGRGSAGIRCL